MTRRARKEARLIRRLTWAATRDQRSADAFTRASRIADNIPLGQPILVGHHSEAHARRDADRIHANMSAGVASADMAAHHRSVAAGIQHQLNGSIFSDDPDAREQLQVRIAELEAQRARRKAINAEIKRGDGWVARLTARGAPITDAEHRQLTDAACFSGSVGYPAYAMTNLGANIRRLKARLLTLTPATAE